VADRHSDDLSRVTQRGAGKIAWVKIYTSEAIGAVRNQANPQSAMGPCKSVIEGVVT